MGILGIYLIKKVLVTNGKELFLTINKTRTQRFNGLLQKPERKQKEKKAQK
jgi:hypothetical protein